MSCRSFSSFISTHETAQYNIKQLLNEVEHDIENYEGRGLRRRRLRIAKKRIMKDEAEVDNTNRGLDNSRYHAKTECFIMYSKPKNEELYKWNTRKFHVMLIRTFF